MEGFRYRWRRRPNWSFEAYYAFEGEFTVGQILSQEFSGKSLWAAAGLDAWLSAQP